VVTDDAVLWAVGSVSGAAGRFHSADAPQVRADTAPGTLAGAKEPQAAVDETGRAYVTFGAGNAVYCAVSGDGGKTFAAPVKVAEAGELSLGMRRGPRIVARGKTLAVSAIYGREGRGRTANCSPGARRTAAKPGRDPPR
jgi:hypothetical protein